MDNLDERKANLLEKLNSLKSIPEKRTSETEFLFKGKCGNLQLIETNIDPSIHGISSGQFMERTCVCGRQDYLSICVGIGLACPDCMGEEITDTKFIWVLEEGEEDEEGISYYEVSTFEGLAESFDLFLVP
jgi:hypothetical protein